MKNYKQKIRQLTLGALLASFLLIPADRVDARVHRSYVGGTYRQQNRVYNKSQSTGAYTPDNTRRYGGRVSQLKKSSTNIKRGYATKGGYPSLQDRRTGTVPVERYYRQNSKPGE